MKELVDVDKFKAWLIQNGAEVLPTTNEYESVRFKGKEVGVLYSSGKTSNLYTANAISCFIRSKKWDGKPVNIGRKKTYVKEKVALLGRDGDNCFLCGQPLLTDITVEHLLPLVAGGKNTLANMVLVHEQCNFELGTKSIYQKVQMAIEKRLKLLTPIETLNT